MENYDICIIGAGPAGCACAYTASKLGLKTLLVEKNNYLGGLMTGGLVVPSMKTDSGNINTDFYSDLVKEANKLGGEIEYSDKNDGWFNPELLKITLDKMLINNHADILFESYPISVKKNKNKVQSIEFMSNVLSLHIESKYFVDTTGDAKIFQLLGENFYLENEKKQPSSLRFFMSGVNLKKLRNFLEKNDKDRNVTNSCIVEGKIHLTSAYTWDSDKWNLAPIFKKALENKELEPFDTAYFQIFTVAGANDTVAFNCPRMRNYDPKNQFDYSKAIAEARCAIYRISKFMVKNFDGFQNAYISQIAPMTGVRASNMIIAKKQYLESDLISDTIPNNPVLSGDYPIDIHSNDKSCSVLKKINKYYLSLDSLISSNYQNLFSAGRCLGADIKAQSALRIQKSCMSMGEAVAKHIAEKLK